MSDSGNKPKSLPPDDFSATVPNIKIPDRDFSEYETPGGHDWEKTNYNYNIKDLNQSYQNNPPFDTQPAPKFEEFEKPFASGAPPIPSVSQNPPKGADWGMTQPNIKLPSNQLPPPNRPQPESYSPPHQPEYGATTPIIKLPEYEQQKYQNIPPAAATVEEKNQTRKKSGIPIWGWILAVLLGAAFFGLLLAAGIRYWFFPSNSFELVVTNAPAGSDIRVDGMPWSIKAEGGNYRLLNLRANEKRTIEIKKQGSTCQPAEVTGKPGEVQTIIAVCSATDAKPAVAAGCDPTKFSSKDIQKSHDCAYEKLRALPADFTVRQLLEAMNLYIINFDSGKYNIKPDDEKFLQESANFMKKLPPNVEIEVGGHTDNKGNDAGNQTLSENRASAVRDALAKAGVKREILLTRGYGKSKPKDTNDTEDGRFRNRRIEYSAIIR